MCTIRADFELGSTVQQIDSTNTPGPAIKYFPFGAPRNGTTSPERAFTGQQREDDSPLGMYYYHARFYSSVLGHFMSTDPTNGSGANRYGYVYGNPVRSTDPTGYACLDWVPDPRDCVHDVVAPIVDVAKVVVNAALNEREQWKLAILDRLPDSARAAYREFVHYTNSFLTNYLEGQFRLAFEYSSFGRIPHDAPITIRGSGVGLEFDVTVLTGCRADICAGLGLNHDTVITVGHTIATLHDQQWIAEHYNEWITILHRELGKVAANEDLGDDWIVAHVGGDYANYLRWAYKDGCGASVTDCASGYVGLSEDFKLDLLKLLGDFSSRDP